MPREIFREEALQRLRSPEQLDEAMKLSSPKGWIAVIAAFVLTLGVLGWSFWARIPVKIQGYGILIYSGRLTEISAETDAILKDTFVRGGQVVRKGQLLAVLKVPDLEETLQLTQAEYNELALQTDALSRMTHVSPSLAFERQFRLSDVKRRVTYLRDRLNALSHIRAPSDAIVMEVVAYPIASVNKGASLLILSPVGVATRDLVGSIFISALDGKHVKVGDRVELKIETARPEQHGYMIGRVRYVSILPATTQAVHSVLKIGDLATYIHKRFSVSPLYIEVEPVRERNTLSGYKWTGNAPKHQTLPGTLTTVQVIVDENRPIDYLFPIFERIL